MRIKGTIVAADDNQDILESLSQLLKYDFDQVFCLSDPGEIIKTLEENEVDLVLLDMNYSPGVTSGEEGLHWIQRILDRDPSAVVIAMTAFGDVELAVKAMQAGAMDFVSKPWDPPKLMATLSAAVQLRRSRREVKSLRDTQWILNQAAADQMDPLVGISPAFEDLLEQLRKVALSDASILITGENGTGKELVAKEVHRLSSRSSRVFIGVDMGSLNESLFESEMFGHVKGAFTDANQDRAGRLEAADGGTLFLDEIGNLSMHLQSKLLRVLEENTVSPVGSNREIPVDFRLIAATNRSMPELIRNYAFREDLYFRIHTIELRIPPLRERKEDIPVLLDHFLRKFARKYEKSYVPLRRKTLDVLANYTWPGNVRELRHAAEKAVVMHNEGPFLAEDFLPYKQSRVQDSNDSYRLADIEKQALTRAMEMSKGNLSSAARLLDISRTTLYSKMEKHGL